MSQFMQLFRNSSPDSPSGSPKREGRFRKFRRNQIKSTNTLDAGTNLSKKRSVSTSALTQLKDSSNEDLFIDRKRTSTMSAITTEDNNYETEPKNQISVKELIEKMITHLQVLERKNEILTQNIQQLSDEKTSIETELSSTKVELNLYKNRLNQIEQLADEWHCSLCKDNKIKIINSKRQIVTTFCGHLFCSVCAQSITSSARQPKHCPVCRKPLKDGQHNYHPIFL